MRQKFSEDKYHFLIACDKYRDARNELFLHCVRYNILFERYTNVQKFLWLLTNIGTLQALTQLKLTSFIWINAYK